MKGSGVVFTRGEGISTPHVRHKGRQPLIECANMTLIFTFPFMSLYPLYPFYVFFFFGVDKGVSLLPTYSSIVMRRSYLRSSLRTEHWLNHFYFFERLILVANKIRLRRWTLK